MKSATPLSDTVKVDRRFQRSIRLQADWGQPAALQGYVLHKVAQNTVETTISLMQSGQGAFTWTGPYGGGKSSLALAFASSFHADKDCRNTAKNLLQHVDGFDEVVNNPSEWLVVLVSGRRGNPVADIRARLTEFIAAQPGKARTRRAKNEDPTGEDVIDRLVREYEARPKGGVLLIVDELGKYLESASDTANDIHFFQDLAEAANRSQGKLAIVGILHQAFEKYADRLGSKVQEEWSKIQGRFVDVPLVTGTDEVINLIGNAVNAETIPTDQSEKSKAIANLIAARRPVNAANLSQDFDACWPLHAATATLLGPISRRRFGQNERSVFGFLSSAEPSGFSEFLNTVSVKDGLTFAPADLWDYLQINLEPAIAASPDGHRWALAVDALGRIPPNAPPLIEKLLKTIAIIDLFGNGSGLAAEPDVLRQCLGDCSIEDFEASIDSLHSISTIAFRRHLNAFALFQGSDFEIDKEIEARIDTEQSIDLRAINNLPMFRPVLAKRLHFKTGTPRWFEFGVAHLSQGKLTNGTTQINPESAGKFLLLLPEPELGQEEIEQKLNSLWSQVNDDRHLIVGIPKNHETIIQLARELVAIKRVQNESPQLEGDLVGRREVDARLSLIESKLAGSIQAGIDSVLWRTRDANYDETHNVVSLASKLASDTFCNAATIHSELANRQKPSSNTNAAIRNVLYSIAHKLGEKHLGFEGYPAERGLISTVYEGTGLYRSSGEGWSFIDPRNTNDETKKHFSGLWDAADVLLKSGEQVSFATIYENWAKPPYGLRRGLMQLIGVAYLSSRINTTAIYVDGVFQPKITDLIMDLLLQDPSQVSLRGVVSKNFTATTFKTLTNNLGDLVGWQPKPEPLPVAQAMVEFVFKLPNWTRKAHASIPEPNRTVRRVLLDADDPHQLFEVDLPQVLDASGKALGEKLWDCLVALDEAFPKMLNNLRELLLSSLKVRGNDFETLRLRAEAVKGRAGDDLKLSGFITRLLNFDGSDEQVADICGLVTSSPVSTWHDLEPSRAAMQLSEYAYRFRRLELFGNTKDTPTQTALMVMAGIGENEQSVVRRAQVAIADVDALKPVIDGLSEQLQQANLDQDQLLAVIAQLTQRHLESDDESDVATPILGNEG